MKDSVVNKTEEKEDLLQAKEEAKELIKEISPEQLQKVAGGASGDDREDVSEEMANSEYAAGEVEVDGWKE